MPILPVALGRAVSIVVLSFGVTAWALPTITVASPMGGSVGTPTFFDASASTSTCSAGIAAIRIYTAPGVHPFTTKSPHLETFLNLRPGNYKVIIQAWDNCGGISKVPVSITVVSAPGVHLFLTSISSTTTPVHIAASAENPACPTGMAAMRIYPAPGDHVFTNKGGTLNAFINLHPGTHHAVAQAWDNCGNVFKAPFTINVTGGPLGRFLYVVQSDHDNIAEFRLNAGRIINPSEPNPPPQFSVPAAPNSFAVDPSGNFGYAVLADGRIVIFNIDRATGKLFRRTTLPGRGTTGGFLTTDRSGNFLFVAEYGSDSVASYRIDRSSGALTLVDRVQTTVAQPSIITTDWRGRYVFTLHANSGDITNFFISTLTGKLVPFVPSSVPTDRSAIAMGATDKVLYVLGIDDTAFGYTIGPSGTLTAVPVFPFVMPECCGFSYMVDVDPFHNLLFHSAIGRRGPTLGVDSLREFRIGADGTLFGGGAIGLLFNPLPVTLDPSYQFVYTCDFEPVFGSPRVVSIAYNMEPAGIWSTVVRPAAFPQQIVVSP